MFKGEGYLEVIGLTMSKGKQEVGFNCFNNELDTE